jgi:hypothetical protein
MLLLHLLFVELAPAIALFFSDRWQELLLILSLATRGCCYCIFISFFQRWLLLLLHLASLIESDVGFDSI